MATDVDPIVGNWYQRLDKGQEFEVVAFDEEDGIVEIQHADGNREDLDIDSWYALELEAIDSPDEYAEETLDDSDVDEIEYDESDIDEEDWDES
ncbi:MAG: hypothetical protein L0Y38_00450 [Methylococcaceae bacterium]|nr:hypothetical protein [Methylococcaceae bacterium]MCI0732276.1 hypothetical protein [Methylococcaceae bacterium]